MGGFQVGVHTSHGRGMTASEWAARCADKMMAVSNTAPPELRDQALAYKARLEAVVAVYIQQAINSDRTTMCNMLEKQGHQDVAEIIRRL